MCFNEVSKNDEKYLKNELKLSKSDNNEIIETYINGDYNCNFKDFINYKVQVLTKKELIEVESYYNECDDFDNYLDKLKDTYCNIIFQSTTNNNLWIWCD
jgi:hypothetical protein